MEYDVLMRKLKGINKAFWDIRKEYHFSVSSYCKKDANEPTVEFYFPVEDFAKLFPLEKIEVQMEWSKNDADTFHNVELKLAKGCIASCLLMDKLDGPFETESDVRHYLEGLKDAKRND